ASWTRSGRGLLGVVRRPRRARGEPPLALAGDGDPQGAGARLQLRELGLLLGTGVRVRLERAVERVAGAPQPVAASIAVELARARHVARDARGAIEHAGEVVAAAQHAGAAGTLEEPRDLAQPRGSDRARVELVEREVEAAAHVAEGAGALVGAAGGGWIVVDD